MGIELLLKNILRNYCEFYKKMGYDCVSYECGIANIMPGSGVLEEMCEGAIQTRADFERYPWDKINELYFKKYSVNIECLISMLPEGMKIIGGIGNGVFECVQDLVGY